ncbi:hypothetical protein QYF36_013491 [Acer negundo]|nr:hypothetical protein QYF36_013491 [Acer negundo]
MSEYRNKRWSLKGMTALVTGGTKGIGYAIVEELAGFGAVVHTCSRNQTEINDRIQEWQIKGLEVSGSVCDLKIRAQREKLMETVSSLFHGKLNILVNNAGIAFAKETTEVTAEDFSNVMSVPLLSLYSSTKGAMNQLTKNLACEWAKDNMRVNAIAPGVIRTPLLDAAEENSEGKKLVLYVDGGYSVTGI